MSTSGEIAITKPHGGTWLLELSGEWRTGAPSPGMSEITAQLEANPGAARIQFACAELGRWDSSLLTLLQGLEKYCTAGQIKFDPLGLPEGVRRLLALAAAVPEREGARRKHTQVTLLEKLGSDAQAFHQGFVEMLEFIGEAAVSAMGLLRGRGRLRVGDTMAIMRQCGVEALPIVSLISLLVGLILAFVGAVQLMMFGAELYVASLVGVAMVRVMGAIMTGIIMAGRTGAAFAAQLGTMQVNEEIDALRTMGISPMEFLVLPRMLALGLMMPLLCLYADLMGLVGGLLVGVFMLDLNFMEYYHQTALSVSLADFWIGILQAGIFGVLVAVAGCMRGMQCGRSASAVGNAATSAVVTGIVSIILATALITMVCNVVGI